MDFTHNRDPEAPGCASLRLVPSRPPLWSGFFPRKNETGSVGPLPGTSELSLCVSVNNNIVVFLYFPEHPNHQMNVDCRLHLWKMKIFTRTCVSATQDHII